MDMEDGMNARFDRLDGRFDQLEAMISQTFEGQQALTQCQDKLELGFEALTRGQANLERLFTDMKESLETEMRSGFSAVNTKLDDMSTRLDRQGGLLRTGSQRIAKLDDWAEKVDKSLENKDREIAELRERVIRLEQKKSA
jgi:chromosome segregation ATPase